MNKKNSTRDSLSTKEQFERLNNKIVDEYEHSMIEQLHIRGCWAGLRKLKSHHEDSDAKLSADLNLT